MRIFVFKHFYKFTHKQNISNSDLIDAIKRAEQGLIDADLGGGVIKQRIARKGQGKSGGLFYLNIKTKLFLHTVLQKTNKAISLHKN